MRFSYRNASLMVGIVAGLACSAPVVGQGFSEGPDVIYTDCDSVSLRATIGDTRAYSIQSDTCNIGNQVLGWGPSVNRSPILAMNVYRLHEGRLMQLGASWTKGACCAFESNGCGLGCTQSSGLGPGCLDVYSAGFNAGQGRMAPRSTANPFTGALQLPPPFGGTSVDRLIQVQTDDLRTADFPGAIYFIEGVYVAVDDAPAGNALNNASYKRVNVGTNFSMVPTGQMFQTVPAIFAWRDHGNGPNLVDPSVQIVEIDVPGEGRMYAGAKVIDNKDGTWRYEYAIYNLTSKASCGSLEVPVLPGVNVTNIGFHDVDRHSGENIDSTDWTQNRGAGSVAWATQQPFDQDENGNYIEWGTLYNYWFDADAPPQDGSVTLGTFRPHSPDFVVASLPVPQGPAVLLGDLNCDGVVSVGDINAFVLALTDTDGYRKAFPDCNALNGDFNDDGAVTVGDINGFVAVVSE